ncbi:hypothetical protein ABZZ80_06885 [Streptomyces sp. NPDC006356]
MPNLPPPVWGELFYSGAWNTVTDDMRVTTSPVTITRGLSSESASAAEPTTCSCDLDSRDDRYAPRNPTSPLYGLIGRNTPFRTGYNVGSPWAAMPGTSGSKLTTPDSAQLAVTGDLDLRIDVALEDWTTQCELAGRYSIAGDNRSWALIIAGTGQIQFLWSPDGTLASRIAQFSTIPLVAYNGQRLALRVTLAVDNGAGGYEVRFYTGRTVDDEEWHLLGDPVTGGSTTSVFDGSAGIELGDIAALTDPGVTGNLYAFQLRNGINGATVVNMATSAGTPGGTSFAGSTGETWTVAGGATLTNKHIRMSGEVPAWPPTRDLSLKDNYVSINPSGVTRRMDAGNKPTDSALLRFIQANNPIECWPLTDGIDADGAASLVGGRDMTYYLDSGFGGDTPVPQGGRLKDWVENVLQFKAETIGVLAGGVPNSTAAASAWSVDFFLAGGGEIGGFTFEITDRGAGTDAENRYVFSVSSFPTFDELSVNRGAWGETSSSGALLTNIASPGIFDDRAHHFRLSIDPLATSTDWAVYIDGVQRASGNMAGIVFKAIRDIRYNWSLVAGGGLTTTDQSLGFITYWDSTGPTAGEMYDAFTGFQGERAGDRIVRLATEAGYVASVAGESVFQQRMGIQGSKKLLELMNDAARTDFGYVLDARDRAEVIHRGQSTLWNQPPSLTLDFSAGLISPPFKPVDDDKLTENDISVQREFGSVPAREVLDEGTLSVQAPEDGGVGRYDKAYTYSVETDAQARQVAGMRLHLGTYNGVRYTRITLNLANERVFALIDDILRIDVGDKIRLTDLPADHGPDDVDVLVVGYTEEAGPDAWLITFNCVPGEPWTAGVVGSTTYGHADTAGCELAEALDASETAVDVFTTAVARWVNAAPVLNSNPSFDSGITGWAAFGGASIAWDSARGHKAPGCLALTTGGAASPRAEGDRAAVSPNKLYVLSGWLSSDVALGVTANVSVNWYTALGGSYISTSTVTVSLTAEDWTWVQGTVTAPATANAAGVLTSLSGTPAAGLVWRADDLELREYVPDTYTDSLPFDVRTGGEVMKVTASTPGVWDTFTRSVTDGWGTADIGGSWTLANAPAADFDVNGSAGTHTVSSVNSSRYAVIPAPSADVDLVVDVATSALAAGGSQYAGAVARYTDANNLYFAKVTFTTAQAVQVTLQKRVAGVQTDITTATAVGITHAAGTFFTVRLQVIGSTLRAKVWPAGGPEPVAWMVTTTDTALTAAGSIGVRSVLDSANTNTLPVTVSFNNFQLLNPQTFTVTRSVNGVSKAHSSSQAISLAHPVYVAM